MKTRIQELHQEGIEISAQYRKAERRLISILQEMDSLKGFRDLGFRSLHEYATRAWKLSDDVAYILISLARKSKEVPVLKEKLEREEISISNARLIAPILDTQNQSEWILKAETLTKRELDKEIKREFPERAVPEQARYVTDSRLELKLGVSEELHEKLKRVQDLLAQSKQKHATLEEALEELASFYLEKKDPVKKAERARPASLAPGRVTGPLSNSIKNAVSTLR